MSIDLSTRVAIVTGAGAGLGAQHALALAAHGARVVVSDMNGEAAEAVCAQICAAGGEAIACAVSVTDLAAVEAMRDEALARWGRVDILVNNAGILRDKTFAKMSIDNFRAVIEVHLMGSVNCTKAVWQTMRDHNYGRIVFKISLRGREADRLGALFYAGPLRVRLRRAQGRSLAAADRSAHRPPGRDRAARPPRRQGPLARRDGGRDRARRPARRALVDDDGQARARAGRGRLRRGRQGGGGDQQRPHRQDHRAQHRWPQADVL
ncbi:hypothetical protein B2G71_20865 [Novosphingobium sp. PC22D]|nr:hypothetical protein B2G71_20865 [Novosphingobium sp. PC22D]